MGAVVLAAGEASRFGGPKLLMPFGESTIIGSVVAFLEQAGVSPILVVAGSQDRELAQALRESNAQVVRNPEPGRGMLSSVRIGVAALPADIGRFVVVLGDQPRVQSGHLIRLLDEQKRRRAGIAIPTYRGKRGHPVVFDGRYREEILACPDSQSLRDVIHAHPGDIAEVEIPSDAVVRDIDTQERYEDERRRSLAEQ